MSATEILHSLLDERGVPWKEHRHQMPGSMQVQVETLWGQPVDQHGRLLRGIYHSRATEMGDGRLFLESQLVTPEQAVEATLGRGTCKIHDCEGSFSAVNRPVWRCDCGAFMTQYTDATTYHKPRFCPNCGRKVVEE